MNLTIRFLGLELLCIDASTEVQSDEPGDCTTTGFGFTPSHGDQRWVEVASPDGGE